MINAIEDEDLVDIEDDESSTNDHKVCVIHFLLYLII